MLNIDKEMDNHLVFTSINAFFQTKYKTQDVQTNCYFLHPSNLHYHICVYNILLDPPGGLKFSHICPMAHYFSPGISSSTRVPLS